MRIIPVAAITLVLAALLVARPGAAGELIPGGWLMPPRVQQAAPVPIAREAPRPPPPTPAARPKPQPRPASQPPAQRPAPPSDGRVQF
jgi:hypothetical protein